jgi:hypothetical protein
MAPEVWHQRVSKHSDQYSLAATYAEMRMGRRAFAGRTPIEIAEAHLRGEPDLAPLPYAEQVVLRKALAKQPDKRYRSCADFARALAETFVPRPPSPPGLSRNTMRALVGGMVFAMAVLVAFLIFRPPADGTGTGTTPGTGLEITAPKKPDWIPDGWEADGELVPVEDSKHLAKRIKCKKGDETVVAVLVRGTGLEEQERSFYIMENKVWNDLYAAFRRDPRSGELLNLYSTGGNREQLVSDPDQWKKGAYVYRMTAGKRDLGIDGAQGGVPVFRVTATEAHCFAEWLGGKLPTYDQWCRAAGLDKDSRIGPFDDPKDVAFNQLDGPWRVDRKTSDRSMHQICQIAGNGQEWTRDTTSSEKEGNRFVPFKGPLTDPPRVRVVGKGYADEEPMTFEFLRQTQTIRANEAKPYITFRVVLK